MPCYLFVCMVIRLAEATSFLRRVGLFYYMMNQRNIIFLLDFILILLKIAASLRSGY